jgi:hypothetical protein
MSPPGWLADRHSLARGGQAASSLAPEPGPRLERLPLLRSDLAAALAEGDKRAVESACRAILTVAAEDEEVWRALGVSLLDQGRVPEALVEFRRAMAILPTWPDGHVGYAMGFLRSGDSAGTQAMLRRALALRMDDPAVHTFLAHTIMPGEDHYALLKRLQQMLRPKVYLEIGVRDGSSIALASPPTVAIGIDPQPEIRRSFVAETLIHPITSDAYFELAEAERLRVERPVDLSFIDGLHLFEQSLRDFINVEGVSHRNSIVLLHDCIPLDSITAERSPRTRFHTGDVWKTLLCLSDMRPDLAIDLVEVPPTGMAIVRNLDPDSRVLRDAYSAALSRYVDLDFSEGMKRLSVMVGRLPNHWPTIESRLRSGSRRQPSST